MVLVYLTTAFRGGCRLQVAMLMAGHMRGQRQAGSTDGLICENENGGSLITIIQLTANCIQLDFPIGLPLYTMYLRAAGGTTCPIGQVQLLCLASTLQKHLHRQSKICYTQSSALYSSGRMWFSVILASLFMNSDWTESLAKEISFPLGQQCHCPTLRRAGLEMTSWRLRETRNVSRDPL